MVSSGMITVMLGSGSYATLLKMLQTLAKQLNSTHFINILQPTELGLPGHLLSMKMSLKFQEQCVVVPLLMIEGGM